jgi:hypothetical protein
MTIVNLQAQRLARLKAERDQLSRECLDRIDRLKQLWDDIAELSGPDEIALSRSQNLLYWLSHLDSHWLEGVDVFEFSPADLRQLTPQQRKSFADLFLPYAGAIIARLTAIRVALDSENPEGGSLCKEGDGFFSR